MKLCLYVIAAAIVSHFAALGEGGTLRVYSEKRIMEAQNRNEEVIPTTFIEDILRRRQLLKDYLTQRREQMQVVATTVTHDGQVLDWIDPRTQVSDGILKKPPPVEDGSRKKHERMRRLYSKLGCAHSKDGVQRPPVRSLDLWSEYDDRGPEGTVPVLRRDTLADVLSDEELPESIEDFLSKTGKKNDVVDHWETMEHSSEQGGRRLAYEQHYYAAAVQKVENLGGSARISIWEPHIEVPSDFSISQVSISDMADTKAPSTKQTIEAGIQDFGSKYGDSHPHFFIYYTTNGYIADGDNLGGYNLDVAGFVQVSDKVFPGARIPKPYSAVGEDTQYDIKLKIYLYQGDWWIKFDTEWVGYYPGELFAPGHLQDRATFIKWYGEVYNSLGTIQRPKTSMGSGYFPDAGYGRAAYMRNIRTFDRDDVVSHFVPTYTQDEPSCYEIEVDKDHTSKWGSYFFYGGPGCSDNASR